MQKGNIINCPHYVLIVYTYCEIFLLLIYTLYQFCDLCKKKMFLRILRWLKFLRFVECAN